MYKFLNVNKKEIIKMFLLYNNHLKSNIYTTTKIIIYCFI